FYMPSGFIEEMEVLKRDGTIRDFLLTPSYEKNFQMLQFFRKKASGLRDYAFDVWLTGGEVQIDERYIAECVLPKHCVRIVVWHNLTFLLKEVELVKRLLGESKSCSLRVTNSLFKNLTFKVKKSGSFLGFFYNFFQYLIRQERQFYKMVKHRIYERILLPKFIIGKTFRPGAYDLLTQLGSGRANAYIFCDPVEVKAHQSLFKDSKVYLAQYPTYGVCRCQNGQPKKNTILSPLSAFIQRDVISEEYLALYYRDFKTVLDQSCAKNIHLRMHPDETGKWYQILREYLSLKGLNVSIVDCEKPIREVMCDYLGVAGSTSSALRNARAACNHAFVIGFEAVSKFAQGNPRFHFGSSEGIGWINEDGTYDPSIFKTVSYTPPPRKTVPTLVKELATTVVS
ncbi:MAG: hypothetical protein HY877_01225, partial [Deltaproteobacteria bacterium]|nr:hypothetical protein [Deltaproteobacteria bacterium]